MEGDLKQAFMSALADAHYSRPPFTRGDVRALIELARRKWSDPRTATNEIRSLVRRWATKANAQFACGWSVKKFVQWVDEGMPDRAASAKGPAKVEPKPAYHRQLKPLPTPKDRASDADRAEMLRGFDSSAPKAVNDGGGE